MTDCARISLEFATAEGLERAAKFVLQSASTFKNRVANPTDEGYRDLMFTVLIENHVCEVTKRHAAPRRPFCPAACSAPHRFGMGRQQGASSVARSAPQSGRLQTHTLARSTHTLARALTRHGSGEQHLRPNRHG